MPSWFMLLSFQMATVQPPSAIWIYHDQLIAVVPSPSWVSPWSHHTSRCNQGPPVKWTWPQCCCQTFAESYGASLLDDVRQGKGTKRGLAPEVFLNYYYNIYIICVCRKNDGAQCKAYCKFSTKIWMHIANYWGSSTIFRHT